MLAVPLRNGSRIAILGGGPAGACTAAAMLTAARRLGRIIEVTIFHASSHPDELAEPLVIDEATAARLASLGVGVPRGYLVTFEGLVFHGAVASFPALEHRGPLSVVAPGAPAAAFRRLLRSIAAGLGARLVPSEGTAVRSGAGGGLPQVRARGLVQGAELLVAATGIRSPAARRPDGLRAIGLEAGGCLMLRSPSGLPRRFTSRVFVFARPPEVPWLLAFPLADRLFISGGALPERLVAEVARLQRDGLLPLQLEVDRAWNRPWRRTPTAAGSDNVLRVGEAAGALWPFGALATTVTQSLRLAEDVLAVPTGGPSPALRHTARGHASQRSAIARWQMLPRLSRLDPDAKPARRAASWLLGSEAGPGPALSWDADAVWRLARRWFRRVFRAVRGASEGWLVSPVSRNAPTVFVVDDDESSGNALADWFSGHGVRAIPFHDELSLLARAARARPAAIILDVVLRRTDGMTLLRELQHDAATRSVPIVLVSGADLDLRDDRVHPHAFLRKPLDLRQLWDLVRPLLPAAPQDARAARA